jgi:UDP-glucuronate 4-epimerase
MTSDPLNKTILVTGAAGFIGFHTIRALAREGATQIIGIDNINDYYDPKLKLSRLEEMSKLGNILHFEKLDLADQTSLNALFEKYRPANVIHLAAQAGVRYSLDNPYAYLQSNLVGFMNMLECARHYEIEHMVYASSSSVYGANTKLPFSVSDRTDHQVSLYASTKKANESMAFSYSSMYGIPLTGLRFFTVYGPFGRPDMAYFKFTKSIFEGKPITVYNNGDMMRDFTYIDDIVEGLIKCMKSPAKAEHFGAYRVPHKLYNIGNNNPENLGKFIQILERLTGREAVKEYLPIQTGDVLSTYADIDDIHQDLGFTPSVPLERGLDKFVTWYRDFYGVQ